MIDLVEAFGLFIEVATLCKTRLKDVLRENNLNYNEWRILHFLAGEKIAFWTETGQELFITSDELTADAHNLEYKGLLSIKEGILTFEGKVLYKIVRQKFEKLAKSVFEFQEARQREYFVSALNAIKQLIV